MTDMIRSLVVGLGKSGEKDFHHVMHSCCRGQTHKRDVLDYCHKMALAAKDNASLIDRDSTQLLWKFLHLLVKQNGVG